MWAPPIIYLFIYLFMQVFNAMTKAAKEKVTQASRIIGTKILSIIIIITNELFPSLPRHSCSGRCHNHRKSNV
jgi:hypothetical protein